MTISLSLSPAGIVVQQSECHANEARMSRMPWFNGYSTQLVDSSYNT